MDDIYKKDVEAYVDEELAPDKRRRMEETLESFSSLDNYAKKIKKQNELLKKWWEHDKQNYH